MPKCFEIWPKPDRAAKAISARLRARTGFSIGIRVSPDFPSRMSYLGGCEAPHIRSLARF
jgi:hypothetical protein